MGRQLFAFTLAAVLGCSALSAVPADGAENRYALVVSGATGGQEYVAQYARWSADLAKTLVEALQFDPARVTVLSETRQPEAAATAENVRRALASIRDRMTRDDLLLVVLIGHGTFDGVDAKFNLVGPDLESADWAALLRPFPGRVVVVNTTSAQLSVPRAARGPAARSSSPRPIPPRSGSTRSSRSTSSAR